MKYSQNFRQANTEVSVFDHCSAPDFSRTGAIRKAQNVQRYVTDPLTSDTAFSCGVATDKLYVNGRQTFKSGSIKLSFTGRCTPKGTILIADDDEDIRETLGLNFSDSYRVLLATNGFDALRAAQDVKPSLFLLDYHMPGMDGIELYDRLHAIKAMEKVPTIIMSAYLPKGVIGGRQVRDLKKPFDFNKLLQMVEEILI